VARQSSTPLAYREPTQYLAVECSASIAVAEHVIDELSTTRCFDKWTGNLRQLQIAVNTNTMFATLCGAFRSSASQTDQRSGAPVRAWA
jgi:hypothetical protein